MMIAMSNFATAQAFRDAFDGWEAILDNGRALHIDQLTDEMIEGRRISNLFDPDFGVYHSCDEIAVCQNAEPFMPI